jgi:hypothetical protein
VGEEIGRLLATPEFAGTLPLPCQPVKPTFQELPFGLHNTPGKLKERVQQAIDESQDADLIILGYGLCGMGLDGVSSERATLVIPKMNDCIGIFLGSHEVYLEQLFAHPGTFYLTKGWIQVADDPYSEYLKLKEKYPDDVALALEKATIEHYTRIVFINTGDQDIARYREYAQTVASTFDLEFEEIKGSNSLVVKLLSGDWGEDFIVVEPGQALSARMFLDWATY